MSVKDKKMNEEISVRQKVAQMKGIPLKEDLVNMLLTSVVEVKFKKLNGDTRVMPCTLLAEYLPPANKDDKLSQTKIRNLQEEVIVVWALESKAWRSFRYERVEEVKQMETYNG